MVSLKRLFVVSALFSAFLFALNTFAFTGPTTSPNTPGSGGSLQLDSSGNIGVGTSSSTPVSTFNTTSTESGLNTFGKVFMVASTTNPGIGLKNLTPTTGNTFIWSSRGFGNLQLYRESQTLPGFVVMDINKFGDVAIGTSTPSGGSPSRLTVNGTTTVSGNIVANAVNATLTGNVSASAVTTGIFSSGNFAFQNALGVGTTSLVGLPTNGLLVTGTTTLATTAGNVGIGTTAPDQKLQVAGNIRIPVTGGKIAFGTAGASPSDYLMLQDVSSPTSAFEFVQDSIARFVVQGQTGNVGIGTSTPAAKLHVYAGDIFVSKTTTPTITLNNISGGMAGEFAIRVNGENFEIIEPEDSSRLAYRISEAGGSSDRFINQFFYDGTNVSLSTDLNGNVGVRTSNPSSSLHVVGSTTITDDIYLTNNKSIRLDSGSNTTLLVANYNSGIFAYGTGQTASLAVEGDIKGNRLCFGDADCQTSWSGIVASGGGNYWVNSGSNLYPSSTSWNVGVGTTTPTSKLYVLGGDFTISPLGTGSYGALKIESPNSISVNLQALRQDTGAFTRDLSLNARGGNVGIGTTTPSNKLTISDGTSGVVPLQRIENYSTGDASLTFGITGIQAYTMGIDNSDSDKFKIGSNSGDVGLSNLLTITSGGLVGIGTTTPTTTLHVVSGGGNAATFSHAITIGYPALATDAARKDYVDAAVLTATSSQYWTLNGSNLYPNNTTYNIGIGTTTPTMNLQVASNSVSAGVRNGVSNLDSTNFLYMWSGLSGASNDAAIAWDSVGDLRFGTESVVGTGFSEKMRIETGGNVGIGTTTPTYKLQVDSGASDDTLKLNSTRNIATQAPVLIYAQKGTNSTDNDRALIVFNHDKRDNSGTMSAGFGSRVFSSSSATGLGLDFATGGTTSRMVINHNGLVGIGTTTPATTLHVVSGGGNAATFSHAITIGYPALATDAARKDYVDNNYAPISGASGVWKLSGNNLYASSTSYSVGIGTATPSEQLHVSPIGQASSTRRAVRIGSSYNLNIQNYINPNADSAIFQNAYIDGGTDGQASYKWTTSHATYGSRGINMSFVDGITFYADNARSTTTQAFTPTERMRITNSGNVGIGTTSPSGALDVVGTSILGSTRFVNAGGINYIQSGSTTRATDSWLPLYFGNYGTTATIKMVIDSSGNVGVGTTTPGAKLHLQGTEGAATNSGTPNGISWVGSPTTNIILAAGVNGTGGTHSWLQSQNRISATFYPLALNPLGGNVGIGTTTPVTALHVVGSGNAATFSGPITIGYPALPTDAMRKDYADAYYAPITGASGIWKLSGNNLYASSTSYNVGIGLTNPAAPLNVYATSSLATSTETIRLSAPQNYTAGFGPKLSFWNGTSEQLALISGVVQTTSNGNFGSLHFGTRTTDVLGVQTKMSILANGSVGVGTTTPANRLSVVGGNISIQPSQVIGSGLTFDSPTSAASSSIELYNSSTGDLTIRTGYTNGDILLMPRQYVGIGTTTPSAQLHVISSGAPTAIFSHPITVGYPALATDAARKDYVDAAISSGSPTAYATSSGACDVDATCEMQNADLGGTGNITGVNKLTVTTIDPLYQIKGKKYSTYASAIVGGVKEEYVGREEMKRVASGKWQAVIDFSQIKDGSDLWVWRHAVDFSENSVEVLVTPIGVPVPVAYEIKGDKIIFSASSGTVNSKLSAINFSYRLIGKRLDWAEWPTYAKDQSEKPGLIYENYIKGFLVK